MSLANRTKEDLLGSAQWTPERVAAAGRNTAILIGVGIALGLFAVAANLYYVAAVIGAAVLLVMIAWQFDAALVVYALAAFVLWGRTPDLMVGGSGMGKGVYVSQIMLGFLLAVWVGKYLMNQLPRDRIRSGFHIPLALYLAYSVLNVVHSFIFWDPHVNRIYQYPHVNLVELGLRVLSAGAFVIYATTISNRKWLKWALAAALLPGFYNMFNAVIGWKIPLVAPWWPLVVFLPACYCWAAVLEPGCKLWLRIAGGVFVAVCAFVIFYQNVGWVSGWLGLFTGLFVMMFIKSRRVFAFGLAVAVVAGAVGWAFLHERVIVASEQEGDFDRFALFVGAWKYATNFPLGVGLGNYRSYNSFYYGWKWGTTAYTSAHGTYSQHLAEMGVAGLALLLSILALGFRWVLTNLRNASDAGMRVLLLAVLGQMAAIWSAGLIGDYIFPTYHNGGLGNFSATLYSWVFWGIAVAAVRISGRVDENRAPVPPEPVGAR